METPVMHRNDTGPLDADCHFTIDFCSTRRFRRQAQGYLGGISSSGTIRRPVGVGLPRALDFGWRVRCTAGLGA